MKRIRKRYLSDGEIGLISKKRGKQSNRKIPDDIRIRAVGLMGDVYRGFGPTLACEKLKERDGITASAETVRKWLINAGMWAPKRSKSKRVYQRRARRSRFGELLQGDGSSHDWFEGRNDKCVLLQFVDDATSKITAAKFVSVECTEGYLELLSEQLEKHGRPLAIYVDKHSVFRVNREELKKGVGSTHFGRVLKDLEIELICAHSPQAKGRVERKNGVLQDRLIKEMRLRGISSMEEANAFLPQFVDTLNEKFGVAPANPENAHRALRQQDYLKRIFAKKDIRKLSKDLTFQHQGALYLVQEATPNRLRHAQVEVLWRIGEPIVVEYLGKQLQYKKWSEILYEQPTILDSKGIEANGWMSKQTKKPGKSHPWR
jgi:hypothetical protein